jgi:alpha-L-rhamnosidase
MSEILAVTFEHHRDNLGIGESAPRISWSFKDNATTWNQASYEIEISRQLFDSGKPTLFVVESSDSILVPWPTTPLMSRESAQVRVRAVGVAGMGSTPWSQYTKVEAGLLSPGDWTASLIAAERTVTPTNALRPALFRKSFEIISSIKSARLYITAQGLYEAHLNGSRVGDHVLAPGWTSYNHHLMYQAFDVTDLLKKGENAIGVEVGEGWFSTRLGWGGGTRNIYGDRLAVLAQLEVLLEDGQSLIINSDTSWKTSVGPILSSEIYDGEIFDASVDVKGWSSSIFDESHWVDVQHLNFPTAKLQSPQGPPVRRIQQVPAQKCFKTPNGKLVVDFGQNLVGWLKVRVTGPIGHKITFTHTEVLENGECATRPLRICKQADCLILAGYEIEWEPKFTFHGFRYVQVDGWPGEQPSLQDISAVVIHTDMERTGWFECSDPMVNKLHENITWGMRGNFVSIPTDCPQRDERLGWTGDIQVFSPTASFLYNTSGMLAGWLKDLAAEQIKDYDGVPPVVCPNVLSSKFTVAQAVWADVTVITPYDLYTAFGDTKILLDQHDSMKAWLEKGLPRQSNGFWDVNLPQLGDWLDPVAPPSEPANGRTDTHFVANAYLIHSTSLMSKISHVLNLPHDVEMYNNETARLKKEFQNEYITPNGRLASESMTGLSIALSYGLFSDPEHIRAAGARLATIVRQSKFRIATGFVGTPLICPALTAHGSPQLAYRMLLEKECPSWMYPITMGATTMWERWDSMLPDGRINPGEMTSFNHYALGAVAAWLHNTVGGISPAEPGWKKIRFEPIPGGAITSSKVKFLSGYGMVENEWKIEEGKFKMMVRVPPNTSGVIILPGKQDAVEVRSGVHRFTVEYSSPEWPPTALNFSFERE